ADDGLGSAAGRLDHERFVLGRDHNELTARVGDALFAEVPGRTHVTAAVAAAPVRKDALLFDVIADLEVRHGLGRFAADALGFEDAPVFFQDAERERQSTHVHLRELANGLFALDADNLVLEELRRT